MKMYVFVFILTVLVAVGQSKRVKGPCPIKINQIETIDLNRYLGVWYDIYTGKEGYGCADRRKCKATEYKYHDVEDHSISVNYHYGTNYGTLCSYELWQTDYDVDARLFYDDRYNSYYILDTDYDSYAVEVACVSDFDLIHEEQVVLRSRNMTMEDDVLDKLVQKIVDFGFAEPDLYGFNYNLCKDYHPDS